MEELAQRDERLQDLEKVDKEIIQMITTASKSVSVSELLYFRSQL